MSLHCLNANPMNINSPLETDSAAFFLLFLAAITTNALPWLSIEFGITRTQPTSKAQGKTIKYDGTKKRSSRLVTGAV